MVTFLAKVNYNASRKEKPTNVCVGIDPDYPKIIECAKRNGGFMIPKSPSLSHKLTAIQKFCWDVMQKTHSSTSAFKMNVAFFRNYSRGEGVLKEILQQCRHSYPHILTIGDAKAADIGNTNLKHWEEIFEKFGFDAMTTNPYMGEPESIRQIVIEQDKFLIPVLLTSNPDATKVQKLRLDGGKYVFEEIGRQITQEWETRVHCGVVIGATKSEDDFIKACIATENNFVLVPGVGAQGGDLAMCARNLIGRPYLVNSSREIIYSDDQAAAAEKLRLEIRQAEVMAYAIK